jgi:DNA-binding NarL/FixJ family response regulator
LITVVIVDDHPLVRVAVRSYLEADGGFDVLGEGETGEEGVDLVDRHRPDVVLLDYQMPVLNGLEAAKTIGQRFPDVGVVMLTAVDSRQVATEAAGAGVGGFVLKSDPPAAMAATIREVAAGRRAGDGLTVIVEPDAATEPTER